jgi:hypothetical protein
LGTHTVTLRFAGDLTASVTVVVVSDEPVAEVNAADSESA